jgi:hypothetical protein
MILCDINHRKQIDDLYLTTMKTLIQACPTSEERHHRNVPGWNDYVKTLYEDSRRQFLQWKSTGKPRNGDIHNAMRLSKAKFKYALRSCKNNEETLRANALAKKLMNKNDREFWRDVKNINNSRIQLPSSIDGVCGAEAISNMWLDHYGKLFNMYANEPLKLPMNCAFEAGMIVKTHEVDFCIKNVAANKAAGPDGLTAEHFKFCSKRILVLLSVLFSSMLIHGYLPSSMVESVLVPIVKNKCASLASKDNYRPIALSNVTTKFLESVIISRIEEYLWTCENQFGFKKGSSTDQCIYLLKELIHSSNQKGSFVFCCFLDASKAFDRVNHNKLMYKLYNKGIPTYVVRLLAFWYSNQSLKVRWGHQLSNHTGVSNGVRQGGILSPLLFNIYMDNLSSMLQDKYVGLSYGTGRLNHLMYADDIVLFSPSVIGLQTLIDICKKYGDEHDILFNTKKTVSMIVNSVQRNVVLNPTFYLGENTIENVENVKYLGHVICNNLKDDHDMLNQIKSLYCRSNMLSRKFFKCSDYIKCSLFKAYCSNLYCGSLWFKYTQGAYNRLRVAFNNSCRIVLSLPMRCSASQMFVYSGIRSLGELIRKQCYSLMTSMFFSAILFLCVTFEAMVSCLPLEETTVPATPVDLVCIQYGLYLLFIEQCTCLQ